MVPLIEALVDEGHMYLVFPYADGGELFEVGDLACLVWCV